MPRHLAPALVACSLVTLLATACTSGSSTPSDLTSGGGAADTPISTKGSQMDLLCGFVSRGSIDAALGRTDYTATGRVEHADKANPDGTTLTSASCTVPVAGTTDPKAAAALSVHVVPFTTSSGGAILQTAQGGSTPSISTYPSDVGIGFATDDGYTDAQGNDVAGASSGLVRGDWVVRAYTTHTGAGRNPRVDIMALVEQVAAQLKLPVKPTKPYPHVPSSASATG